MSEEKKPRTDPPRQTQAPHRRKAQGYGDAGASQVRRALQGFLAKSGAPSEDIDFHNFTLRQRGRMLYMSSPVAAAAINTNRTKVVGTGLYMKCAIDRETLGLTEEAAKEWQRKTEKRCGKMRWLCFWSGSWMRLLPTDDRYHAAEKQLTLYMSNGCRCIVKWQT